MPKKDFSDKDIEDMLRKMGREDQTEYPADLIDSRRKSFVRQILLNKFFWLIVFVLAMVILCVLSTGKF
jgi:hypothetical protein